MPDRSSATPSAAAADRLRAAGDTIRDAARATEQDRYLSALLAPRAVRDDLITIAAFLGDVARIPRVVSDPRLGEIRLQWWIDTIEGFATGAPPTGHPLADALRGVAQRRGLDPADLAAAVEARSVEFAEAPIQDQCALEDYLDGTEGAGFRLAARILEVPQTTATEAVLRAAGRSYGLVRVLQSLPRSIAGRRLLLPLDWPGVMTLRDAASQENDTEPMHAAVVARCAGAARQYRAELHGISAVIPHSLNAAILPCALVEPYLQALERRSAGAESDPGEVAPLISPLTRVWRLWRAHRRGRL